jgi:hypothetical protein
MRGLERWRRWIRLEIGRERLDLADHCEFEGC